MGTPYCLFAGFIKVNIFCDNFCSDNVAFSKKKGFTLTSVQIQIRKSLLQIIVR